MLLDRFRKKIQTMKDKKSSDKPKERVLKVEKKIQEKKQQKEKEQVISPKPEKQETTKPKIKQEKPKTNHLILRSPQITEKAVDLQDKNQYVFKVSRETAKTEIKKVVENIYNVVVEKVAIVNIPAKKKRLGRTSGWQKGYKKAIVSIKKGQTIEIMPR